IAEKTERLYAPVYLGKAPDSALYPVVNKIGAIQNQMCIDRKLHRLPIITAEEQILQFFATIVFFRMCKRQIFRFCCFKVDDAKVSVQSVNSVNKTVKCN